MLLFDVGSQMPWDHESLLLIANFLLIFLIIHRREGCRLSFSCPFLLSPRGMFVCWLTFLSRKMVRWLNRATQVGQFFLTQPTQIPLHLPNLAKHSQHPNDCLTKLGMPKVRLWQVRHRSKHAIRLCNLRVWGSKWHNETNLMTGYTIYSWIYLIMELISVVQQIIPLRRETSRNHSIKGWEKL
jgi:hypothetical protein